MSKVLLLLCAAVAIGCGDGGAGPDAAAPVCDLPLVFEKSPGESLEGSGWHRIYIQGSEADALPDGRFAMNERRELVVSGDHFLLSQGALVEFVYPVTDAISGHVFLHLARVDDPDVVARYELALVHDGQPIEILSRDDPDSGDMGYLPFEECFLGAAAAVDPAPGDYLLLRVTNISGGMLGVVTRSPDYFTWIDVEVQ